MTPYFCHAKSWLQHSWTDSALISALPPPPPRESTVDPFQVCGSILDCWQLAQYHLSMQHLSLQHLPMQHLSLQHLSGDKIWLFTIATSPEVSNILAVIVPMWTKQLNFKLATEPNHNMTNFSNYWAWHISAPACYLILSDIVWYWGIDQYCPVALCVKVFRIPCIQQVDKD